MTTMSDSTPKPNSGGRGQGAHLQTAYHVIPDLLQGGWNVYATHKPQEPQEHFSSQEQAVAYAERMSQQEGVDFAVEDTEAPEITTSAE